MHITQSLRRLVDDNPNSIFEYIILFVIIVNMVSMGLETVSTLSEYRQIFFIIDQVCLWIFIVEIIIKFIAYNKDFFKYKWNIFDLVIVAVSILSSFSYFTVLRVLRIFRSARILNAIRSMRAIKAFRFIDSLNQLKTIFTALIKSIPGIIWTCLLLMIFFYIYAIVGTNSFGSDFPEYFGSLGRSLLTLFQVMSFDSWFSGITRPVLHVFPWAWVYFISFALISTYVIMNIIIGILVNSIEEVRSQNEDESDDSIKKQLQSISAQLAEISEKVNKD
ncbi:MAG: ion transporter [Spirochaetales bacterium]|nr:ion transporter [Spirochaetales bacterium]MBR6199985.1 ion transporter [Spirochaetales bacterium]